MNQVRKPLITLCAAALLSLFNAAHAQETTQIPAKPAVVYNLPKHKLSADIVYKTLVGNIALTRQRPDIAYEAYMALAAQTRDPRYAELAYKVAALVNEPRAAVVAASLLKELAPNAVVGQDLVLTAKIANAYSYIDKQEYRPAYEAAQSILTSDPKNIAALALLVEAADHLGYSQEALKAAETWLKIEPNSPEAQNNLGYFLADKNIRLDEAEKLLTSANTAKPNTPHIMDSLGWLAYRQGRLADALPLLRQAAIMEPSADVLTHLGEVLWQSGQFEAASAAFKQAFGINAYSTVLRDTLERLRIPISAVNVAPAATKPKGKP